MQHHRRASLQERAALWMFAAVVCLSVLSSLVLLFNPADPMLQVRCAQPEPALGARPVSAAAVAGRHPT